MSMFMSTKNVIVIMATLNGFFPSPSAPIVRNHPFRIHVTALFTYINDDVTVLFTSIKNVIMVTLSQIPVVIITDR